MKVLRTSGVVLVGLISAPLLEVAGAIWLTNAPVSLDLTGSYFTSVVFPAALFVHTFTCLVFWKLFIVDSVRNCIVYVGVHALAQTTLFTLLGNPLTVAVTVAATVGISGILVTAVFCRYFWCETCGRTRAQT